MVPEEIGTLVTTDCTLNFLEPAHKVEAEPGVNAVWVRLEGRPCIPGAEGARLNVRMPIETALRLYACLGDAIDRAVQRGVAQGVSRRD